MPSLRKRVSTYLRQLSFHNEPRDKRNNVNENAFVTKYLQGHITLRDGPPIIYGKNPTDLPSYDLGKYECGSESIIGCYSVPNGGLTTVKRTEKHLSVHDDDIDFIDNPEEEELIPQPMPKKSPKTPSGQPIDNTTMVIKVAGHEYCVTNKPKRHSKSFSLGSISDFIVEVEKTKINRDFYSCDKNSNDNEQTSKCQENQNICDNNGLSVQNCDTTNPNINISSTKAVTKQSSNLRKESHDGKSKHKPNASKRCPNVPKPQSESRSISKPIPKNYSLSKSQSEGHPFQNKKRGKIIQVQRQQSHRGIQFSWHGILQLFDHLFFIVCFCI